MKMHKRAVTLLACSATMLAGSAGASVEKGFYLGIGPGLSYIKPDTNDTGYSIDESKSSGGKLYLGYDLDERLSIEGYYSDMGEVRMNPAGSIGYRDIGIDVTYYLYRAGESREGLSAFARLGVGKMKNDTVLNYTRENDTHFMVGAGVEYGLGKGFAVRGDFDMYDKDAHLFTLSLMKRFGSSEPARVVAPQPQPVVAPEPVVEPPRDSDGDGILDLQDECPETLAGAKVDARGCVLETVIELKGVAFALNSAELIGDSDKILDEMAETLKRYPEQRVEVAGYTDSQGSESYNKKLSSRRANAVRDYLVGRGVAAEILTATGYGEEGPVADNGTAEGRARNRRVELHLLQ